MSSGHDLPAVSLEIDATGKLCPQPILDLAAAVREMTVGSIVRIISDDAAIEYDLPAWCSSMGHELIDLTCQDRVRVGRVRKLHP